MFTFGETSFDKIYDMICNCSPANNIGKSIKHRTVLLKDFHMVSIALQMRGESTFHFKFRPQHVVHDELCMILQKRAFRLIDEEAVEIKLEKYNPHSVDNVMVREIAFGPDCDPSVRDVALWFGILDSEVVECTAQQAKRFRWKRGLCSKKGTKEKTASSKFDLLECFNMLRPSEHNAYQFTTHALTHRLQTIKALNNVEVSDRSQTLKQLEMEKKYLKCRFGNLVRSWECLSWPPTEGREKFDRSTSVPSVDAQYSPSSSNLKGKNRVASNIWQSFVALDLSVPAEQGLRVS
jgi:hypothetical protein